MASTNSFSDTFELAISNGEYKLCAAMLWENQENWSIVVNEFVGRSDQKWIECWKYLLKTAFKSAPDSVKTLTNHQFIDRLTPQEAILHDTILGGIWAWQQSAVLKIPSCKIVQAIGDVRPFTTLTTIKLLTDKYEAWTSNFATDLCISAINNDNNDFDIVETMQDAKAPLRGLGIALPMVKDAFLADHIIAELQTCDFDKIGFGFNKWVNEGIHKAFLTKKHIGYCI